LGLRVQMEIAIPKSTGGGNGIAVTCGEVAITYGNGTITFTGLATNDYFFKVNDLNNGWAQVGGCSFNCGHQFTVRDLPNSTLLLSIYNSDWSIHCTTEIQMTGSSVTGSASTRNAPHLSFAAYQTSREVELEWLSNSGFKVSDFAIEHSTDGTNFKTLSQFVNKEWSDELEYHQLIDETPETGDNYYRVKEIYLDGSFAYTDVQKVNFNIDLENIAIFPNPARGELFLNLKPYVGKKAAISLVNHFGQEVKKLKVASIVNDLILISTAEIPNGLYYLNIKIDQQKNLTKKIMVHNLY